ncbi:alpha N-terminal protein methyltransferase 1 isoform X2 [Euphorbia lathyris]|uniref:alpha N-terminal protein methyltransferase 1 isoform X2 n=1 Tax=Euphorbia lathyris TaxID=212925 RepID=UPI0033137392
MALNGEVGIWSRIHPTALSLFRRSLSYFPLSYSFSFDHPISIRFCTRQPVRVFHMEVAGSDSDGSEFKNADEMWRQHTGDDNKKTQWYRDGVSYWEGVEASVDGVLGGYGHVNDADVKGSEAFIQTLFSELFVDGGIGRHLVALDCGSGIGRVTKNLLIRYFNEEFTPDAGRYDVIWVQWCIGHLTDDDFVSFFKRAKIGLKHGGFFVLKENIARSGFVLDKEDRSITRSDIYFKELFSRCGLHLYKSKEQRGLPKELFGVKMYALVTDMPKKRSKTQVNRPAIIK